MRIPPVNIFTSLPHNSGRVGHTCFNGEMLAPWSIPQLSLPSVDADTGEVRLCKKDTLSAAHTTHTSSKNANKFSRQHRRSHSVSRLHRPPTNQKTEHHNEGNDCSALLQRVQTFHHGCSRYEVESADTIHGKNCTKIDIGHGLDGVCDTLAGQGELKRCCGLLGLGIQLLGNCAGH